MVVKVAGITATISLVVTLGDSDSKYQVLKFLKLGISVYNDNQ